MATSTDQQDTGATRRDRLNELRAAATSTTALKFYDSLPAVEIDEMLGAWAGSGIDTGHPFDGLLERFGWHGKRFDSADAAHPLVMRDPGGKLYELNPALVPVPLTLRFSGLLRHRLVQRAFPPLSRVARTTKPRARLRTTVYRGVASATMCYDALPIHDVFRRVDDTTVMGAMDMRGLDVPYLFVLHREERDGA